MSNRHVTLGVRKAPKSHIIKEKTLQGYWDAHPDAEHDLRLWIRTFRQNQFSTFAELRHAFQHFAPDYAAPYTIFDICNNTYRLITVIRYPRRVFIKGFFTHAAYNRWTAELRKKKGKR